MRKTLLIRNKWQGQETLDKDIEVMWAKMIDLAKQGWKILQEMTVTADKDGKPYYTVHVILDTEEGKIINVKSCCDNL